jgi:hypothetical protein
VHLTTAHGILYQARAARVVVVVVVVGKQEVQQQQQQKDAASFETLQAMLLSSLILCNLLYLFNSSMNLHDPLVQGVQQVIVAQQ